ncbi:cation diffusion facilitator family transporter [Ktedonobacter sp. SOSP1-52]|uniref:cation diffusion facilitator family transporter n=1 Tax=Ktedonobacter sp. SOSP1-52 TaxID=2778366 RepID=UPI001914EC9D|nr:cation diffusion facilitator family transporter [Ktedonobacter sp. SOSP1-52]
MEDADHVPGQAPGPMFDQHKHRHTSDVYEHEKHKAHEHHAHDHAHEHEHEHEHEHDREHGHGRWGWLLEALPFVHGHSHAEASVDTALESSDRGIWALKISLLGLGVTALFQLVIAMLSGSVGLLADTIHNFSDALTAVPLWIAFAFSRRAANRRYTYGYGRLEDLAGVVIVLMIFLSALLAGYESITKFLHPESLHYAWWVMLAAIVGFAGNEGVAIFRIRVGKEIGSAALVADGKHAQADGLTSLAVLIGAAGSLLGFPLVDPAIGLLITLAILFIVKDTALVMWHRLMDAVDPQVIDSLERAARAIPGVLDVPELRARWLGRALEADMHIEVDENLSIRQSHDIAEEVRHALFHTQPRLATVQIHVDPHGTAEYDPHSLTRHHMRPPRSQAD